MRFIQIGRREFIGLIGGAATAWPLGARAQRTAKVYRIARIYPAQPVAEAIKASKTQGSGAWIFFEELRRLGFVEGQNLVYERYSAEGRTDEFSELARDVVRSNPDLIYADGTFMVLALKAATTTIPIVAGSISDPVAVGIAASIARPGNITGVIGTGPEFMGKYVELLKEAVPGLSTVGFLASRKVWELPEGVAVQEAARRVQISLIGPPLEYPLDAAEYRRVIAAMAQAGAQALIVNPQPQNYENQRLIIELAETGRLPAIFPFPDSCKLGGLMAYAFDGFEVLRQFVNQIAQILRGTSPGDIPFYQPTKFALFINLKTAKALGVTFPPSILARADEVIE
jgi:putative tryptophan/tyrosine transport system substrate-binding protein